MSLEELRMNLGSGVYGDLMAMQAQPPQQPRGSGGGFWDNLGRLASTVFTGPSDPRLSPSDEMKARNRALMQGGLYTILASGQTDHPVEALAQGALAGQQAGANERAALGGPQQMIEQAMRSGDPRMVDAVTRMLTPTSIDVGGGQIVSSPMSGSEFIPDTQVPQLRQGEDGNWYAIDPMSRQAEPIQGIEAAPPEWRQATNNRGDTVLFNTRDPSEQFVIPGGSKYVVTGDGIFDISTDPPTQITTSGMSAYEQSKFKLDFTDQVEGVTEDLRARKDAIDRIVAFANRDFNTQTGADHYAMTTDFVRLNDPGVSVRYSEYEAVRQNQSLLQRIMASIRRNVDFDAPFLTERAVENMKTSALIIGKLSSDAFETEDRPRYEDAAAGTGLDTGVYLRNPILSTLEAEGVTSGMTLEEAIEIMTGATRSLAAEVVSSLEAAGAPQSEIDALRDSIGR